MVFKRLSTGGMESKQQHTTSEEKEITCIGQRKKIKQNHLTFFFGRTTARRRESLDPIAAAVRCVVDCGESLLGPLQTIKPIECLQKALHSLTINTDLTGWNNTNIDLYK